MASIRSLLFCVCVAVFFVLFCVDLAYRVEGDIIPRLANIGDNITLSCYRPDNFMSWFRNGTFIANYHGVVINDPRFTQGVNNDGFRDSNKIHISNIRMNDSTIFQCRNFDDEEINTYDLRVIKCSNCIIAPHSNPAEIKVICTLDNYWTSQVLFKYIILNGNRYKKAAIIEGNIFYFSMTMTELNRLPSEFYLQIEKKTKIICMVPTQPTPLSFPTTTLSTTSYRPPTLSYTASTKQLPTGRSTSISTTIHHTPKNKNASSNKNTRDGNITLIIVILCSVFILILIVIIVLRCKNTKDRQENKHIGNVSIKKEIADVCYESLENGSQKGPQNATYMELRGTKRESKSTSKVTDRSSNSDHFYGNSVIITQHEQIRGTLQRGDQYENVKMPGSGDDAEEIPLYDMPDEGPTRNTLKATPEAGHTSTLLKDEVVSGDVLYAEVD